MIKLFSYITYGYLIGFFYLPIDITLTIVQQSNFSLAALGLLFILVFSLSGIFIWYFKSFKRVYLNGASLYIYELLSNKSTIVYKKQLVTIVPYRLFLPYTYKTTYTSEGNKIKTVYFIKSFSISNIKTIINDLI